MVKIPFNVILLAMFQNSSIHNRDQIVFGLQQGLQTDPQMQQMQAMTEKLGPAGIKALNDQAMAGNMPSVEPQE